MSDFAAELTRLMAARGLGVRELARMVPCNPGHISNLRSGKREHQLRCSAWREAPIA